MEAAQPPKYYPTSNEQNFVYHSPKDDQPNRYGDLRQKGRDFCNLIESHCPPGRERAIAITRLEEAIMWANKAIAVGEALGPAPIQGTASVHAHGHATSYPRE